MVFALGDIRKSTKNTKNITFALIQSLQNDPHEDVRCSAASSLSWMEEDAKDVVPALIQVLENDQYAEVRFSVVRLLGNMGKNAKDAVPALIQVLENDPYPAVRANAAGALKAVGTPEALNTHAAPAHTRTLAHMH